MKFTVESMKLEIVVKTNDGTVLCHEVLDKDQSSPNQSTNENGDQNSLHRNIDKSPKRKSFFSKLKWWSPAQKPTGLNQEKAEANDDVTPTDIEISHLTVQDPLMLENLENVDNASNIVSAELSDDVFYSVNQPVDDQQIGSFIDPIEEHSKLPESTENADTPIDLDVTPLKSSDDINELDTVSVENRPNDQLMTKNLPSVENVNEMLNDISSLKDNISIEKAADNTGDYIMEISFKARAKFSTD